MIIAQYTPHSLTYVMDFRVSCDFVRHLKCESSLFQYGNHLIDYSLQAGPEIAVLILSNTEVGLLGWLKHVGFTVLAYHPENVDKHTSVCLSMCSGWYARIVNPLATPFGLYTLAKDLTDGICLWVEILTLASVITSNGRLQKLACLYTLGWEGKVTACGMVVMEQTF